MKIENIEVRVQRETKKVYSDIYSDETRLITDPKVKGILLTLRHIYSKRTLSNSTKLRYYNMAMEQLKDFKFEIDKKTNKTTENATVNNDTVEKVKEIDTNKEYLETLKLSICNELINFFSEFSFEPNYRFVNTLVWQTKNSLEHATNYISNYFTLCDHRYCNAINEKIKSYEFKAILNNMIKVDCTTKINNRLKLYYGSQGTGKTTKAIEETNDVCMVCHSAMLPSDLMEDFKFENGNPSFKPSALQLAMINGTKITLDEINLLPYESLRFLQSILDGKREFIYKGKTINIKDGFQIIGTMNLTVNGCVFSLPEPLIDRASDLQKYTLDGKSLVGALI